MKLSKILMAALLSFHAFSQDYSRVKIYGSDEDLQNLSEIGIVLDHGTHKKNTFFISDFSKEEIELMEFNGINYEIIIPDVKAFYLERSKKDSDYSSRNAICTASGPTGFLPEVPTNFTDQGTYAGYYRYQEMLDALDAMRSLYPNLISAKAPVSTFVTHQGNSIFHVTISDNPDVIEAEKNVLYTAIHHAREPMSMSQTIFFMWYLLENYGTDPEITYLVDNNQLIFIPCLNPDGYLINETNDPFGGGMHRKNGRNVGSTNPGVDNNRNYSYGWGTTGVSTNPNNDTYCGTGPFTEPENQAIQWLVENREITAAFNAHTYGNDLLHPIGTTTAEFADHHDYFQDLTGHMATYNGYSYMKSSGLYPASGDSDDYMYKEDIGVGMKDTIFAMTPEIGSDFWPAQGDIIPTCQDMVYPNLILAHMPHKFLVVEDTDPSMIATLTGDFNHSALRLGLENGAVTVSIEPILNIQAIGSPIIHDLNLRQLVSGAISFELNPSIQFGEEIKYVLTTDFGLWIRRDTITKTFGALTTQVFENGATGNWIGNWSTSNSVFYSPSEAYADSPAGNYANNTTRTYEFSNPIDLTTAIAAGVSFYAKWNIEADYDYCQFQVSTDGGSTWIGQCGRFTVNGTSANGSVQPNNKPVWEGAQGSWVLEEISLSDYLGQVINVRFILESDGGVTEDGFYFDDFTIGYNEAPVVVTPTSQFSANPLMVCVGNPIQFTDESTGDPTAWLWSFGDGNQSTDQNPSHVYASTGMYNVTLEVTNTAGTDNLQKSSYIDVQSCAGIVETTFNELIVYPNPTKGFLLIQNAPINANYQITDAQGRLVIDGVIENPIEKLQVDAENGVYFLELSIGNERIVKRIALMK